MMSTSKKGLIDDVNHASEHNPDGQYFLGSMVLRMATRSVDGVSFEEHELLDGQQRPTTLVLMLSRLKSTSLGNPDFKAKRDRYFADRVENLPTRWAF